MTMKLGTGTGSLVNHLMSGHVGGPTPVVGMGATILHWTDRKAATVVKVSPSGKTVWVKADTATRVDRNGMSESQVYRYAPNPDAPVKAFRLGKHGWRESGSRGRGAALHLGHRASYHDYSF